MGTAYLAKWSGYASVLSVCTTLSLGYSAAAHAQVVPDTTLGNESSVVVEDSVVHGLPTDLIEGGAIRRPNIFHSFADFNIAELQRVYFTNPAGIENILSRITGNNSSDLLGTLGVDGNANLFFLNPNGITFGPNSQLDITGSFFASTADAFKFAEGLSYSATNPAAPPLLAVTLTPGLQIGEPQQGTIQSEAQLQVGGQLSLQAETLNLQGSLLTPGYLRLWAEDTVEIRDRVSQPFVAAAGEGIDIQANQTLDISILENSESGLFAGGDLSLRSDQPIIGDAHFWSGGQFQIEQLDGSPGNLVSLLDPVIEAQGDVRFFAYAGGSLRVLAGGSVNIGNIFINGTDPTFPDDQVPLSRVLPDGVGTVVVDGSRRPVVDIRAGTTAAQIPFSCLGCSVLNPSGLQTGAVTSADINIVFIGISQPNGVVLLTNQFQPNERLAGNIQIGNILTSGGTAFSADNGGGVFIDSRDDIQLSSTNPFIPSRIQTSSLFGDTGRIALVAEGAVILNDAVIRSPTLGVGQGGRVDILANALQMAERSQITTSTGSQERGGDIYIEVTDALQIIGDIPASKIPGAVNTGILSTIGAGAVADGGDITIRAGSLTITDGAVIGTFLRRAANGLPGGQGTGGDIDIIVQGDIVLDGVDSPANTGLDTGLGAGAVGTSGNIRIQGQNLLIQDAKFPAIRTDVLGIGDSGDIEIQLDGSLVVSGLSNIATTLREGAVGSAGNIDVNAQNIIVENGAQILSGITGSRQQLPGGQGTSGNINLTGRESITLSSGDLVSDSGQDARGAAGNIVLATPDLVIENESEVRTATANDSPGGDIIITADRALLQNGVSLLSRAEEQGEAGDIEVNASERLRISAGEISASADAAGGGDININGGLVFLNQGSLLSTSVFDSNGGGGDITMTADALVVLEDSDILANAEFGPGGIISINSPAFLATLFESGSATPVGRNPGSFAQFRGNDRVDISADSAGGQTGTVSLPSLVTDEGLNELPINLIDPTNLIDQRCNLLVSQQRQEDNQFVVVGRGGLPVTPSENLREESLIEDLGPTVEGNTAYPIEPHQTTAVHATSSPNLDLQVIAEPHGWARNAEGRLVLYSNTVPAEPSTLAMSSCSSEYHTSSSL
ncbi:filamentous hemagglutinin N-terminal domain-containing protein [Leptolyngbya cf. ectocarpi LEGE 11479]|uniref:Filamentous hemagglutinin N-terminal domain-containing protein n=1 Tax=Leptolyngbya cf. ectocarpi LEGE 11479 TaxID=1828722 RepID=A0A928ZR22_LEPEC|nr:filamentous hemagglutinin N-terminal domain-containing protein [Leptolyngbya ectocarpi]MBE9066865.1 filamentous hemagglutinin N-terminal domain-containing protein [Leptolyngbya cf. ectocarpi LEGE 11479]